MNTGIHTTPMMPASTLDLKITLSVPALTCPDILAMIFNHLAPGMSKAEDCEEVSQSKHACRKALVATAITCRTLSHYALDVLWRELLAENLHPLLKVLPEYQCVSAQFAHCGAILPEHWARFQVYANRIRIVSLFGSRMAEIHSSVWPFLAVSCRGAPLLPRLREMKAYHFSISGISALTLLLTPTLRTFNVWISDGLTVENISWSPYISSALLQTLPMIAPDLENFAYDAGFNLPEPYFQSLIQFKRLNILTLPENFVLQESMLQMLSSIATLQYLSCTINLAGISAPALPPYAFQGLIELVLHGYFDHLVAFVLACHFPHLQLAKFIITQPSNAGQPRNLSTALCQRTDPTVFNSFVAHFTHGFSARPSSLMGYFEPLLAFPGITLFELVFSYTESSIRDDDLARFGAAWPRLATFYIVHRKHYSQPDVARPTLAGLIELARRCPDLTTLYLPELDPRPVPEKATVPALGHRLRSAWIDNIMPPLTIQVYMDIAAVVDRVFPWIDLVDLRVVNYRPPGAGWVDVLQYIHVMRLGRENGRAYADSDHGLQQRA